MIHDRVAFRPPTPADIAFVAMNMRENDRREILRSLAQGPLWTLKQSIKNSDICYSASFADGTIGGIFGAARTTLCDGTAIIWQLSTTAVDNHKKDFMRASKRGLDLIFRAMTDVSEFSNQVDAQYIGALKWIEYLDGAFSIEPPKRGFMGGTFLEFVFLNPYYKREE